MPGALWPLMTPGLRTARLQLVPLTLDDADEMVAVLADPSLYAFTGGQPPDLETLRERFGRFIAGRSPGGEESWHNWVVRLIGGGEAAGTIQATVSSSEPAAEIGWVIGAPWQGRGYASEAAQALVAWLESRGITSIAAHIHPEHEASERVARRAGLLLTDELDDGERVWRRVAVGWASARVDPG